MPEDKKDRVVTKFEHHGVVVSCMDNLKGKHREHCLCWICRKLNLADRDKNCKIASLLYAVDRQCQITTPVFYCKEFQKGEPVK